MADDRASNQMVLHEMRNALQGVRAFLAVILAERAGPLTAEQREYLTAVRQHAMELQQALEHLERAAESGKNPSPSDQDGLLSQ